MDDSLVVRAGLLLARGLLLIQGLGIATWVLVTVLIGAHRATVWLEVALATALCVGLLTVVALMGRSPERGRRAAQAALGALVVVQLVGAAVSGPASVPTLQWAWPALNAVTLLLLAQPVRRPRAAEPAPVAVDA